MEKYGVEQTTAKTASTECPICGSKLQNPDKTGVRLCPKCGSLPFEEEQHSPETPKS